MNVRGQILMFLLLNALTWPATSIPLTTIDPPDHTPESHTDNTTVTELNNTFKIIAPNTNKTVTKIAAAKEVTALVTKQNEIETNSLEVIEADSRITESTPEPDYEASEAFEMTTTENYNYLEDEDGTSKTNLLLKIEKLAIFKDIIYFATYQVVAVVYRFWRVIIDIVWKPLLRLYISPLRLIHTYLMPELINNECFQVYYSDIHVKESPFKPYRPNKLELVKCIFQYVGHYFRSWQFVNRIEENSYNLI